MNRIKSITFIIFFLFAIHANAFTSVKKFYLFDALEQEQFLMHWNRMMDQSSIQDGWLRDFQITKNGVVTPGEVTFLNDQKYLLFFICEPHNCGANKLGFIFKENGEYAIGVQVKDFSEIHYFRSGIGVLSTNQIEHLQNIILKKLRFKKANP